MRLNVNAIDLMGTLAMDYHVQQVSVRGLKPSISVTAFLTMILSDLFERVEETVICDCGASRPETKSPLQMSE